MAGAGLTFEPVTVMAMVRPAGLELDELEPDDVVELAPDDVVEVLLLGLVGPGDPASSPVLPQAATVSTRASPAAYDRGARGVIFVTNPSLDSAF